MLGTASGIWRQNLKRETGENGRGRRSTLGFVTGVFWDGRKHQRWEQAVHPLEQSEEWAEGKPGLRNALGKRGGGEITDLAAGSPDGLGHEMWLLPRSGVAALQQHCPGLLQQDKQQHFCRDKVHLQGLCQGWQPWKHLWDL